MSDGRRRLEIDYVWPPSIVRPQGSVLVYLDLNQWVRLAQAATGHPKGRPAVDTLARLDELVKSGGITIAISATTYMEMTAISDPRQRNDLAQVIERLSGFNTLLSTHLIMRLEVEALLDVLAGPRPVPYSQLPLVGTGVGHAMGIAGQIRISSRSGESDAEIRATWPGGPEVYDETLQQMQLMAERQLLAGPSDDEVPGLRLNGWNPEGIRALAEKRAREEQEQADRFDANPEWRRGRIRDAVAVRYLAIEILDYLNEAIEARDCEKDAAFHDRDSVRFFVDSMPSADARISLLVARHRNKDSGWAANDIYDLDAHAAATAYCDVVVCENHIAHLLRTERIADRMGTEVLTMKDLGYWLEAR